jgi:hypothetical protein
VKFKEIEYWVVETGYWIFGGEQAGERQLAVGLRWFEPYGPGWQEKRVLKGQY